MGQMFDSHCVKELFRPQKVFTKKALRTVFVRLAHASIMKLNSNAMDKVSLTPDLHVVTLGKSAPYNVPGTLQ